MLDESGDVVRHRFVAERPVDVRGEPVTLHVDGDDLPRSGKGREVLAEAVAGGDAAVEQDQGIAIAMDLVVELETVHGRVVASAVCCHVADL